MQDEVICSQCRYRAVSALYANAELDVCAECVEAEDLFEAARRGLILGHGWVDQDDHAALLEEILCAAFGLRALVNEHGDETDTVVLDPAADAA